MKRLSSEYVGYVISEGTLRIEDLLKSNLGFLKDVAGECEIETEVEGLAGEVGAVLNEEGEIVEDSLEEVVILNESAYDLIQSIAPEGCSFESHPGDGACFGFWKTQPE
jgi:hypothetical protein